MKTIPSEIKLNIIHQILMYQKTKERKYKETAISDLNKLLEYYHVKKKRLLKIDLNEALINFSGNVRGVDSINILRNSI
jgi:DNA-directed RNA polymerase subunit H (RpoH/RPB5)